MRCIHKKIKFKYKNKRNSFASFELLNILFCFFFLSFIYQVVVVVVNFILYFTVKLVLFVLLGKCILSRIDNRSRYWCLYFLSGKNEIPSHRCKFWRRFPSPVRIWRESVGLGNKLKSYQRWRGYMVTGSRGHGVRGSGHSSSREERLNEKKIIQSI